MVTNQQIIKFYAAKKLPLNKLIQRGMIRYGLQDYAIIQAAKEVYRRIKKGEQIPDIRLAWEVWATAKEMRISVKDLRTVDQIRADDAALEAENRQLKRYIVGLVISLGLVVIRFGVLFFTGF